MTERPFEEKLELTNDGKLSLFFIGSGSAFSKQNFQTNVVIVKGNQNILLDCGTLCSYVLHNVYNSDISQFKNILITHPHADHIGGIEEVALLGMYYSHQKPTLIITKKLEKKLWKESLAGGIQFSEKGKMKYSDYFSTCKTKLVQKRPFEIFETNIGGVGGINIKLFRTKHVTSHKNSFFHSLLSYGVIIDEKVLFTGDTQFNEQQIQNLLFKYPTIETIFHDCDVSGYARGVHASYEQLCTSPKEAKAKMYLCHYDVSINKKNIHKDGFAGLAKQGYYYEF